VERLLLNFFCWIAIGGFVGWIYIWRRTKPTFSRVTEDIVAVTGLTPAARREIAHLKGSRLAWCSVAALFGGMFGAVIWSVLSIFVWLLGRPNSN
jgi:hypothetical protein